MKKSHVAEWRENGKRMGISRGGGEILFNKDKGIKPHPYYLSK